MLASEVKLSQTFIWWQVQVIFKVSLHETITFMYKLDQVCADDVQKNTFKHAFSSSLKEGYHLSTSSMEIEGEWDC